ncbi:T9SS type A sorting domain-containing protein [Hymenobacter latericus]|uniref:T9SS type A sorting domain-containing protein n=1 Tax=Hymenobacter sp. YIM 151858-1 TaxID=2987688 RepID=UPI00222734A7|nr:T9SS type A sorting domain-containing protein [Hymenobacter sp. YIM 151858-1]UYZ61161.1 T9SS type A sorting domain-containing protein [Hymenobacter sp. YIM 151858-1]
MIRTYTAFRFLAALVGLLLSFGVRAQTPYALSNGNYAENFDQISGWANGFASGTGAAPFSVATPSPTLPNQNTVFSSGTSGGVQKGTGTILLLATGSTDNSSAAAFDLNLDFTGTTAGTITLDWASVANSSGNRQATFKLQTNTGTGGAFVDLPGSSVVLTNNVASSGQLAALTLPAGFDGNAAAKIRFFIQNTAGGVAPISGSRPKVSIDNLRVTATATGGPVTPAITTGTVAGSPYCVSATAGAAVSVPFSSTGGLSGTFDAQLSDASGVFDADLTKNLIGSGSASPLAATIPAGTPAGTGYRIRVVHAASPTTGSPNGSNLVVSAPPASNTVTLNPAAAQSVLTTGSGSAITATATAPSTFAWFYSPSSTGPFTSALASATAATYTPKGSDFGGAGTYYLVARATSTCGGVAGTSAPVTITVSAPQPTLTAAPNPVPDFGSVVVGSASDPKTVSLTGSNLSGPVTLTPPAGFQLRTGSNAFSCAALTLTPTAGGSLSASVEVRFVPALAQAYSAAIAVSGSATTWPGIAVSGTGTAAAYPPSLSTDAPGTITATAATGGGEVLEDGGSPVTARGLAYATTAAPTTQDDFTEDGTGLGRFTSQLSGLLPSTTYYVRAYATNAVGTSYGPVVSFTTPAAPAADLVISSGSAASPVDVAAGTYDNVTVTGTGFARLAGAVVVNGALTVQTGGGLSTNCQPLTGSGSFTLQPGATLSICDAAGIAGSGATGAVQLTGSRSFAPGADYVYNGTQAQVTGNGLPAQVRNLTSANAGVLTLSQPVAIRQVLTLNAGSLSTGGQALTLLSDATGTALVANLGAGRVSGNVTVQRYLDPSRNAGLGYRHLAAPTSGETVAAFGSGGAALVTNPAYNSSPTPTQTTPFPTVFRYDQARLASSPATTLSAFDKGWVSPATPADAASLTTGFTVQLPGASTLSFTGAVIGGTSVLNLNRDGGPTAAEAGWNFLGNPYPAPLDLSTIPGSQLVNLDAAFYTYESTSQYGGSYRSYVSGFGNPLLGTAQAFFMRVSAGQTAGSLTLTNANRVTSYGSQAPVRRGTADTRPQLQLTLAGAGLSDELTVYAQPGATAGFDAALDAAKLWNPNGLSLAALSAQGEPLAIDGRPAFPLAQPVPLTVQVPRAGSYSFTAASVANLPAGTTALLVDLTTGTRTPLQTGTRLTLELPAGTSAGRLQLEVSGRILSTVSPLAQQLSVYPNPSADGQLQLVRPAAWGSLQVEVLNSVGQVVQRAALRPGDTQLDVRTLSAGVYTLRLTTQAGQTLTKRLVRQ